MEILKQGFVRKNMSLKAVATNNIQVLVLTDSDKLRSWARQAGLDVLAVNPQSDLVVEHVNTTLSAFANGDAPLTLVNAIGFELEPASLEFHQVKRYSTCYFNLLKWVAHANRQVNLLSLSLYHGVITSLMDGLALSYAQETTKLRYKSIVTDLSISNRLVSSLLAVLACRTPRVRIENGAIFEQQLSDVDIMQRDEVGPLKARGNYLITGGSGGIGRLLSQWLSHELNANIFVVGRKDLSDDLKQQLKTSGVKVYLKADIGDEQQLSDAWAYLNQAYAKLDGVFHLAGTLNDGFLVNKSVEDLHQTLAAKVKGVLNLQRVVTAYHVDFICSFTSLSGLIGNMGQSNYAAANAFVDAFSHYQNKRADNINSGCSWFAINWGLWDSDGMQMDNEQSALRPLSAQQGCLGLREVLSRQLTATTIFDGDKQLLGNLYANNTTAVNQSGFESQVSDSATTTRALQPAVQTWLQALAFKFCKLQDIDIDASLIELGVDSVALINIAAAIENRLKKVDSTFTLSKAIIFDYPSIQALSSYLVDGSRSLVTAALASELETANAFAAAAVANEPLRGTTKSVVKEFGDLYAATCDWLSKIVEKFTRMKGLGIEDNLIASGIDSVTSINISSDITRQLSTLREIKLSKAIIFDYPTIASLARHLIKEYPIILAEFLQQVDVETSAKSPIAELGVTRNEVMREPNHAYQHPVDEDKTAKLSETPAASLNAEYRDDDIAIIGVAGEFPGANTVEQLWQVLSEGRSTVSTIPEHRWDWKRDYAPSKNSVGTSYTRHGGFIEGAKEFDPLFFNIAPIDAEKIDPQERRFLQTTYHALEDAGYFAAPTSDVGVFVAAMFGHYQALDHETSVFGSSFSAIANRVSYSFDFQGPSLCVDTMCSGSLTALHLAINSLKSGECRQAIAGAVNVMSHPGKYRLLSDSKFLSPTGHCHSFGIEADGYVPGEGVVSLVLKQLGEAVKDSDHIYGVVRGCAVNAVGRSSGFTVPSAKAQAKVIERAMQSAAINAHQVSYVEAHGTGTSLGDPIEIQGLNATYGKRQHGDCKIGSIKSNIGHLESAAGMAGLVKLLWQIKHQTIVPTLFCDIDNPHLNIDATPFSLAKQSTHWHADDGPRFAALSAFGAGGSNAHVIVQEYQSQRQVETPVLTQYIIPVSGKNPDALSRRLAELKDWLLQLTDDQLYPLGYTLSCCREHFSSRACFIVCDINYLRTQIIRYLESNTETMATQGNSDVKAYQLQQDYLAGHKVDWMSYYSEHHLLRAPLYPFARHEYWSEVLLNNDRSRAIQTRTVTTQIESLPLLDEVLLVPQWLQTGLKPTQNTAGATLILCKDADIRGFSSLRQDSKQRFYVVPGSEFSWHNNIVTLRLDNQQHFAHLFTLLAQEFNCQHIDMINLWSYTASPQFGSPGALTMAMYQLGKGMIGSSVSFNVLHVAATQSETQLDHYGYALSGLFRTLAMEKPRIKSAFINLDKDIIQIDKTALLTLLEQEVAQLDNNYLHLRRSLDGRFQFKLSESKFSPPTVTRFKIGGVYLISGGMGMIGIAITKQLLQRFGATVVLLGRSQLDECKQGQLDALSSFGGHVEYMPMDITNLDEVTACIERVITDHGRLDGVIQSAGQLKDCLFENKTWSDFKTVVDVKTEGTLNLDLATQNLNLDFFVLFSSMSSVFGSVGQADYVVGNTYLDHFAATRNRLCADGQRYGLTLSINWPLWIEDGTEPNNPMAKYKPLADFLSKTFGIDPLTLEQGVALFFKVVDSATPTHHQIAAFRGNREKILATVVGEQAQEMDASVSSAIKPQAVVTENRTSLQDIIASLSTLISDMIKLPVDDIEDSVNLGDIGFNSVLLQQLANRINEQYAVTIPTSAFFTYNTVEKIAEYIQKERPDLMLETSADISAAPELSSDLSYQPEDGSNLPASVHTTPTRARQTHHEDRRYAIVGMDGRLPGGHNLEEFWQGLVNNESAIQRVKRWSQKEYYAGLIPDIEHFDAKFFGLSGREAMLMDPQHRLFLQVSYNAFLDAGYSPKSLSNVGVFAGVQFNDYQVLLQQSKQSSHPYAATGNAHAMLANRVSYLMDFVGPSQTIDTACSSALVAVNRGIMSLEKGECDYALVGAVSLLIDNVITDAAQSMGVLSEHYRCATFDSEADGYVRAEGVGCVVIKRYQDAFNDGDAIYAVIESSAENHGGKANSLTAPNPEAQKRLLLSAYTPHLARRVSYIETHGTGTKLGDPIEIDALKAAWGDLCGERQPESIHLGAVKTNIGHLEPAAGIASLLKVLLAFKHQMLPANIHFNTLNPYINFEGSPFRLLTENLDWHSDDPRVAGISSFGFGGSNAHLVLSQAPQTKPNQMPNKPAYLVTLSARSPRSLEQMRLALHDYLINGDDSDQLLESLAFTLNTGRDHFEYRFAWIVSEQQQLQTLANEADVASLPRVKPGKVDTSLPALDPSRDNYIEQLDLWRQAYLDGTNLDWVRLHDNENPHRLHLPTYCFDTQAYWFENADELGSFINNLIPSDADSITQQETEAKALNVDISANEMKKEQDKVAIVGIAGRFPYADSVDEYWNNLLTGSNCIRRSTRWSDVDGVPIQGGFLDDTASFDAGFFRISPKEAACMDPQQRILLEVSQHAIEDCGLPLESLRERNCGVFVTGLPGDYKFVLAEHPEEAFSTHSFLGNAASSLSGRISYFYDFNGPSITLDTACSSSLTALQQAWLNIQSGSCEAALVGAASVFSTTELFRLGHRSSMISSQGRCATFDDDADGFIPSEGCAAIVLMHLSDAQAQGLDIYGVIESIAINHNGLSNGLMAPNSKSQAQLISNTYRDDNIDISDIGYVEAHGTGTKVGDPIEMQGLVAAYQAQNKDYDCWIGSSKTVIGHTLVCSGLASIIKVVQAFRHNVIPPHSQYQKPNQYIDFGHFNINRQQVAWPEDKHLAAISAFGFTGSNAHLVLRKVEPLSSVLPTMSGPFAFIFSAHDDLSLTQKLTQYRAFIAQLADEQLANLSFSLCDGLEHLDLRLAIIAGNKAQLIDAINAFIHTGGGLSKTLTNVAGDNSISNIASIEQDSTVSYQLVERVRQWLATGQADFRNLFANHLCHRLKLPKYPFHRIPYWIGGEQPSVVTEPASQRAAISESEVVATLKRTLSELLGYRLSQIDEYKPLSYYGVDSLTGIQLLATYKDKDDNLGLQDLFKHDSLVNLGRAIAVRLAAQDESVPAPLPLDQEASERRQLGLVDVATKNTNQLLRWVRSDNQGQPVLLLPPLNTSYKAWLQQLRHIQTLGYQAHIPIYPGHTGNPFDAAQFAYDILVDEIHGYVTDELAYSRIDAIGWSLGGCLSLSVSIKYPDLFSSMTLISTAASFEDEIFGKTIELQDELAAHSDYLDIVFAEETSMVERIGAGATMNVLKHYYDVLACFNIKAQLAGISTRTLVVHGQQDCVISDTDIEQLKQIPYVQVAIFEQSGHFIPLTAARQFNELITEFLSVPKNIEIEPIIPIPSQS